MSGVAIVYKWELLKLRAQKRTYLGLGAAMLVPIIFVVALALKGGQGGPTDIPIGRYIRDTGLATPFVVLRAAPVRPPMPCSATSRLWGSTALRGFSVSTPTSGRSSRRS